jgi:hypothetical protein
VPSNDTWPAPATQLTAAVTAGGVTVPVAATAGMLAGGTLGIDTAAAAAETVTITAAPSGGTVPVTPLARSHPAGAAVTVPVSAAFLTKNVQNTVSFLAYPPAFRATNRNVTFLVPAATFPTGTPIPLDTFTLDTYSGGFSNGYIAPVAGVYYCYGQVAMTAATVTGNYCAGFSIAGGTLWGRAVQAKSNNQGVCVSVAKRLRVSAGQSITLMAAQSTTANNIFIVGAGNPFTKMICFWESA